MGPALTMAGRTGGEEEERVSPGERMGGSGEAGMEGRRNGSLNECRNEGVGEGRARRVLAVLLRRLTLGEGLADEAALSTSSFEADLDRGERSSAASAALLDCRFEGDDDDANDDVDPRFEEARRESEVVQDDAGM